MSEATVLRAELVRVAEENDDLRTRLKNEADARQNMGEYEEQRRHEEYKGDADGRDVESQH